MSWSYHSRAVAVEPTGAGDSRIRTPAYPFNDEFMSSDAREVARFYDHFESAGELIAWMQNRPASSPVLREVAGSPDVVVVIPTARADGPMARHCREEVFSGLQLIFLESPQRPDPFFNFGHYVDRGIARALEFRPRWIVVSGDDVRRVDPSDVLANGLAAIDPARFDAAFTDPPGYYHSLVSQLGRERWLRRLALSWTAPKRATLRAERKFGAVLHASRASGYHTLFFAPGYRHWSMATFGIFSADYLRSRGPQPFDPVFGLGGGEDVELCLRLSRRPDRIAFVRYRIEEQRGGTLRPGEARRLREVAGLAYLNYLIRRDPRSYFVDGYDYAPLLIGRPE